MGEGQEGETPEQQHFSPQHTSTQVTAGGGSPAGFTGFTSWADEAEAALQRRQLQPPKPVLPPTPAKVLVWSGHR